MTEQDKFPLDISYRLSSDGKRKSISAEVDGWTIHCFFADNIAEEEEEMPAYWEWYADKANGRPARKDFDLWQEYHVACSAWRMASGFDSSRLRRFPDVEAAAWRLVEEHKRLEAEGITGEKRMEILW